ncbi:PDZ domain-containing protein [Erythrobacter sp.]|uniref:PDZ domain-containing protein n=1 Tax=Erythrobacter sp. TaxID=1042 RepID=UPI0025E89C66|nr:PDZ domain-containing protein [Erythrobacter sp.]
MKILRSVALLGAVIVGAPAMAQVEPNSDFLLIPDFYHQDADGNWVEYRVAGFSGPKVDGVKPKLWLLPNMWVVPEAIRYTDRNGNPIQPTSTTASLVKTIGVPVSYNARLPIVPQQAAIGAALAGEALVSYDTRPAVDPFGNPQMIPAATANFEVRQLILNSYLQRKPWYDQLDAHVRTYQSYQTSSAVLNEVRLALLIDGIEVASREYPGSQIVLSNNLPPIALVNPSPYEVNKIRNGDFEVNVAFRFRDAKWAFVQGRYNARLAIDRFVEETQKATTKYRSSGFQVLGFGSRRKRLKQSMTQSLEYKDNVDIINSTQIISFDATEDMIKRFEDAFFPTISRDDLIVRHEAAAKKAQDEGKPELAKLHTDYAIAMKNDDPSLEVDMEKAAAALSAQDFAGFLAHGVRFSSNDQSSSNDFRRVINLQAEIDERKEWLEYRQTSVQRETIFPLAIRSRGEARGSLGLCDGHTGPFQIVRPFNQVQTVNSLLVTCVVPGSPMARANLLPGTVILSIDGQLPASAQDLDQLLDRTRPGDELQIRYANGFGPQGTIIADKWVTLVRGKPIP